MHEFFHNFGAYELNVSFYVWISCFILNILIEILTLAENSYLFLFYNILHCNAKEGRKGNRQGNPVIKIGLGGIQQLSVQNFAVS